MAVSRPPSSPNCVVIAIAGFAIMAAATVAGILITDEIHKAELRSAIQDARQSLRSLAEEEATLSALKTQRYVAAAKLKQLTEDNAAKLDELAKKVNESSTAATRKEEVEESDRRLKEYKLVESRLASAQERASSVIADLDRQIAAQQEKIEGMRGN